VSRYARHRQEVPENSVVTVNGDLRTLRRILHLGGGVGQGWTVCPPFTNCRSPRAGTAFLSFAEEAKYLAKASDNLRDATNIWRSIPGCA